MTAKAEEKIDKCLFYFIKGGKYAIADLGYCKSSEITIDMKLYDIANNSDLLDLLNLYYIQGNYGKLFTYESRAEWFCGYLSSFKRGEEEYQTYKKALTNPRTCCGFYGPR